MALILSSIGRLKPEVELGQAISEFEEVLGSEDRLAFRAHRESSSRLPPSVRDVMSLTAQIDQKARREGAGAHRCFGPRFTSFLESVQQYAAVGDVLVGGSQNLIACGVWALVRMTLLSLTRFSTYLDKMSLLLMKVGRSAPRYSEMVLLFPRSDTLRALLARYFTTVVRICTQVVSLCRQSVLGQAKSFIRGLDTSKFESDLAADVDDIKEQLYIVQTQDASTSYSLAREIHAWSSTKRSADIIREHQKLLDRCSQFDHRAPWSRIRKQGSSTLVFDRQEYRDWTEYATPGTLLITGKLGSGKSVLLANIVDDLVLKKPSAPVTYFFCSPDNGESLRCRTVLGSLARQLLGSISLAEKSDVVQKAPDYLDEEAICDLLSSTFFSKGMMFLVLDGIEECEQEERRALLRAIQYLQRRICLAVCLAKRMEAASSTGSYTEESMAHWVIALPEHRPDIGQYIEDQLLSKLDDQTLSVADPNIILEIRDALESGSQGMFLWARLQIEAMCLEKTDSALRRALQNLPSGLPEIFSRVLQRCKALVPDHQGRALKFISAAARPLSLDQFHDVMSVEIGNTVRSLSETINSVHNLVGCCGSLVYLDEEHATLHFIHHSVSKFLLNDMGKRHSDTLVSPYQFTSEEANLELGSAIVTYHNYEEVAKLGTEISTKDAHDRPTAQPIITIRPTPAKILSSSLRGSEMARKVAAYLLKGRHVDVQINIEATLPSRISHDRFYDGNGLAHQFHFQHYARDYWLHHTRNMDLAPPKIFGLFRRLVTRAGLVEGSRLWRETYHHDPKDEARRFVWSIVNRHWAFVKAERGLYPDSQLLCRSIRFVYSRHSQPKRREDIFQEFLGLTANFQLAAFVDRVTTPGDRSSGLVLIGYAALAALHQTLTTDGDSHTLSESLDFLRSCNQSSPTSLLVTCAKFMFAMPRLAVLKALDHSNMFQIVLDSHVDLIDLVNISTWNDSLASFINAVDWTQDDLICILKQIRRRGILDGHDECSIACVHNVMSNIQGHVISDQLYDAFAHTLTVVLRQVTPHHYAVTNIWSVFVNLHNSSQQRPCLNFCNLSMLCETLVKSRVIFELVPTKERMEYWNLENRNLLETAMSIGELSLRAQAVGVLLLNLGRASYWMDKGTTWYRGAKKDSGYECSTVCSESTRYPGHRVFRIDGSDLCECYVPQEYRAVLDFYQEPDEQGMEDRQLGDDEGFSDDMQGAENALNPSSPEDPK